MRRLLDAREALEVELEAGGEHEVEQAEVAERRERDLVGREDARAVRAERHAGEHEPDHRRQADPLGDARAEDEREREDEEGERRARREARSEDVKGVREVHPVGLGSGQTRTIRRRWEAAESGWHRVASARQVPMLSLLPSCPRRRHLPATASSFGRR